MDGQKYFEGDIVVTCFLELLFSITSLGIFYLPCFVFFLLTQGQYFISPLLEKKHHMTINRKCTKVPISGS